MRALLLLRGGSTVKVGDNVAHVVPDEARANACGDKLCINSHTALHNKQQGFRVLGSIGYLRVSGFRVYLGFGVLGLI